jgi:adenine/guanine phosphoribosyltransferase-like PRPP-binding protein
MVKVCEETEGEEVVCVPSRGLLVAAIVSLGGHDTCA